MKNLTRHTFAIFYDGLSLAARGKSRGSAFTITDRDLTHRVQRVLRLTPEDELILFDTKKQLTCTLDAGAKVLKTKLSLIIDAVSELAPLAPTITLAPALLKREDFAEIMRLATVLGANNVQPLLTEKVQRNGIAATQREKLTKRAIAGAEQSKQFVLPKLYEPKELRTYLTALAKEKDIKKIFLAVDGVSLLEVLQEISQEKPAHTVIICGPEGGFTVDDRSLLLRAGFIRVSLTPTILRSVEANALALGAVRSVARDFE